MIRTTRRLAGIALAGAVTAGLAVSAAAPAAAITGGKDDVNNTYSNVALIASYSDGVRSRCTATLVTPTVLLTAGHCTDGTDGLTAVTFDHDIAPTAPSGLPVAADPAKGYVGGEPTTGGRDSVYVYGQSVTHPDYSGFTDLDTWNDVGVVVLTPEAAAYVAAQGIRPRQLAPVGTLDALPQKQFTKTLFTMVGYGTEVQQATSGPRKPTPQSYPLRRQYVEAPGQKLSAQVFQVNGNEHDPFGGGGTCFGDSGGPALLNGQIVGVTSYGYTSNCRYLDGYQRVDIAAVRTWLAGFGVA